MDQNKDQQQPYTADGGRDGPGENLTGAGSSNVGHYTPNPAGRGGGIVGSSPEAQVNPPGKPQSGHGSATEPVTPGTAGAMVNNDRPDLGAAGGTASNADGNLSGKAGD